MSSTGEALPFVVQKVIYIDCKEQLLVEVGPVAHSGIKDIGSVYRTYVHGRVGRI